jgi:hypothetical protein
VCWSAQRDAAEALVLSIDTQSIAAEFEGLVSLIGARALDDPRRECNASSVSSSQDDVRRWIYSSNNMVSEYWGF